MNDIVLKVGNKTAFETKIPSKWNELTSEQFRYFLRIHRTCSTVPELLHKMIVRFLGSLPASFPGINNAQMEDLSESIKFLIEDTDLYKQLVPTLKIGGKSYSGPSDGLTNLLFWEYLKAQEHLLRYSRTKKVDDLNKFVASIYRPNAQKAKDPYTWNGDYREPFNENMVSENAVKFNTVPMNIKEGIVIFWKGCNKLLSKRFPEAFEGGEFKNEFGASGIADSMAGNKFGTLSEVKRAYLYEVLISACNMERMRKLSKKK